jgi:hypothetical protein
MSGLAQISVSLATWKAIESQRLSFDEDHDAIIRRALVLRAKKQKDLFRKAISVETGTTRKRGDFSVQVDGRVTPVPNLKAAYIAVLSQLVKRRPSLFQSLLGQGSDRRRWIAMKPEALFPLSPHLARQHGHQIAPNWFVDTNLSRAQIETRLARASEIAGLCWGQSVQINGG